MIKNPAEPKIHSARTFRAPGRVNLIGEHTDYNSGFVLPIAIQLATRVTVKPRDDRRVAVRSAGFADQAEFDLDDAAHKPGIHKSGARRHWSDYIRGVAIGIQRGGHSLLGADLAIESDVPIGSGLSSSAALEVATAMALLANSGISLDPTEVALLCQRAENEFVGVQSGIMDQFTSCRARAGHALLLDCLTLELTEASYVPLPDAVKVVVCNTMIRHELASNHYNLRRQQCELGVKILSEFVRGIKSLRDVTELDLAVYQPAADPAIDPLIWRRCLHVVTENQRVLDACDALRAGDLKRLGDLMIRSHNSLRDNYEVSCAELDMMVALALQLKGVYGARMTGGGFGGCTVNLVDAARADQFAVEIAEAYRREIGAKCAVYICSASDGAGEVMAPA